MNQQIIEEIIDHFGRTGSKKRPRLRKFHAEILLTKFLNKEKVLSAEELARPIEYIKRIVRYSKGFLSFINEELGEVKINDSFFLQMEAWQKQYIELEELDHSDDNLIEQGIILTDEGVSFDGKLTYSRFYKVISDEGESMNDPESWVFNDRNIETYDQINFSKKNSPMFGSRLFNLKFYVLRKIDEVAFVTSRFVHCPACGANYVIPAAKIDFLQTYKCEKIIGGKPCKTTLKKFPARKMIPTYIYEIGVEVQGKESTEFKEFFLESFTELLPGFYTGMCFGRTEAKSNSFYFTCLTAKEEKARHIFNFLDNGHKHEFLNLVDSVQQHIKKVGFVIDTEKAKLPVYIETLKKLTVTVNKEINLDHSLYFGAPGIGKSYALTMLHHLFYSNSGFISGPRFTLAGLTGGQKEIYYQDMSKKKNVPGLFSNQSFIFDEINNAQFLADDKAINLFKAVALASSGTSTTVGGKEFPRVALISATANYDVNYLKHYENKIKKVYANERKNIKDSPQKKTFSETVLTMESPEKEIPPTFDFYAPFKDYGIGIDKLLKTAILKVRDEATNFLTNFPKPLMERFYWAVLVHPKYDKAFQRQKKIDVDQYLKSRNSQYTNRELISQLFIPNLDKLLLDRCKEANIKFKSPEIEREWSRQVQEFLVLMATKYVRFFSMFNRISQVHVFALFALSLINNETHLSFETKRIFERLISLQHTTIDLHEFHNPNFENYKYIGETKATILKIIELYGDHLDEHLDFSRPMVKETLVSLENDRKITRIDDLHYKINAKQNFEEVKNENREF